MIADARKCPGCSRTVRRDAPVCIHCGADLRPSKILLFLAIGSAALAVGSVWMATHVSYLPV